MSPGAITAICALIVSIISVGLAMWSAFLQRRHMRLSIRPIAKVSVGDYENRVGVFLANRGLGPMLIRSLRVTAENGVVHDDLVSHMPKLRKGVKWSTFYDNVDGAALENGKRLKLLLLEGNPSNHPFGESRDAVRSALAGLTVVVEYEDLYGQRMEPVEKRLSWFGRHKRRTS